MARICQTLSRSALVYHSSTNYFVFHITTCQGIFPQAVQRDASWHYPPSGINRMIDLTDSDYEPISTVINRIVFFLSA
jgi:hypothetical protein